MRKFSDIEELDAFLTPMDYQGFWYAITPFNLPLEPKSHCDNQITIGEIDEADALEFLKSLARLELIEAQDLCFRPIGPILRVVEH